MSINPLKGRLLSKILLMFGGLIVFIIANGIYSTLQWQRISRQDLEHDLADTLSVASAVLMNERDKFQHISLIVREQGPKFISMLEYDQYHSLDIMLRNLAQVYDLDLLLLLDDDTPIASSRNRLSEGVQDQRYAGVPFRLHSDSGLEILPAGIFGGPGGDAAYLCFQAVVPLHYDAGDPAGDILIFKCLDNNSELAARIAQLVGAEVIIYNRAHGTVLSSLEGPPAYTAHNRLTHAGQEYFLQRMPLPGIDGPAIAELAVAMDIRPFIRQRNLSIVTSLVPLLLTLAVSVALLLLLRGRIFAKLEELIATLQSIKGGKLHVRLSARAREEGDEISEMAQNFNTMMERLEHSYNEVIDGRQRLERLNRQLRAEISERKHIAAALREAKQEAEAANRAKSSFLANMSHEIRTPMNAILGYAHLLLRDHKIDDEQRKALGTIARSGNHLLALLNDILDISKIEAGRMELKAAPFNLHEVLEDLAAMFRFRCEEKNLEWTLDCPPEARTTVYGDEQKLRQVLINLLGNALKFTDHGWIHVEVKPKSKKQFHFEVRDSGAGLSAEAQRHIFDAFYQDEQGREKGGTGLGLAISSRHVELMGGNLRVSSTPGQGACFYFTLPLPPAVHPLKERRKEAHAEVKHLDAREHVEALVVDDVAENREVLSKLLHGIGIEVREAASAEAGLEMLARHPVDIVFMDYRLPGGMDGSQATTEICRRFDNQIKVVIVSASSFAQDHDKINASGCSAFVSKPFQPEHIYTCLSNVLGVTYEYAESAATDVCAEAVNDDALQALRLPQALRLRLREAAEFGVVTELDGALKEVAAQGAQAAKFAECVRDLAQRYEMEKILHLLDKISP